ncbi:MAG: Na-translocating system protein MpsC family protein [Solirubrobacteraceae bacterium]
MAERDVSEAQTPFVGVRARRTTMTTESSTQDGQLAAKISNTVVHALSRTTGRGPTQAKTTLGTNGVFVVLQDTLTRGEQTLADAGQSEAVLDLRRRWQSVMKQDVSREIEELTGRKVIGFMSDNHIDPDLAVEVFVLEPLPNTDAH